MRPGRRDGEWRGRQDSLARSTVRGSARGGANGSAGRRRRGNGDALPGLVRPGPRHRPDRWTSAGKGHGEPREIGAGGHPHAASRMRRA